ncbi:MAG TPA: protein-glutamate O-methyltransferase CheR [Dongiaceae bacterium]|nr:protein-glutamate O-methyltransferase CheR [Dongiaceae bacterium]
MDTRLSPATFNRIREYVHLTAGIIIGPEKAAMVVTRLWRRLDKMGCADFDAYFKFVTSKEGEEERGHMLDLLTTNETYFFREPAHFTRLKSQMLPSLGKRRPRVWCAAASTGEEPYSLAMMLHDSLGSRAWDLLATDISSKALTQARRGLYRMERLDQMPQEFLKRYCRRGVGEYDGMLVIDRELREQVQFQQHNLLESLQYDASEKNDGFDIIFLRNVLIYFDQRTKQRVLDHLVASLRPGGWLITGHCESLFGLNLPLQQLSPSVYRNPDHLPARRPA